MALNATGKVLYGAAFLAVLPYLLLAWAAFANPLTPLPAPHLLFVGAAIASAGFILMLLGIRDLWVHGGGLPMNADPPPRYVARGTYLLLPHPIYTGFSLLCVGVSIATGSAAGFWLVSPLVMLACAALVVGYEHLDLRNRFGPIEGGFLPVPDDSPAPLIEYVRCWLFAVLPWAVLFIAAATPPTPRHPAFYLAAAVLAAFSAAPFFAATRRQLRAASTCALAALLIAFMLFLLLPLLFPVNWFAPQPQSSSFFAFFPSPAALCALLAWRIFLFRWPSLRWLFFTPAILAAAALVIARQTSWLGALFATFAFAIAAQIALIWELLRISAERIAGSWKEWRFGPVRIINHGFYAGLGGAIAVILCGDFAGPQHLAAVLVAALAAVIGAALWAQFVEGSAHLLRPYGFYGGLLGGTLGALAAPLFHSNFWMVLAVFSLSGPWAQALGRLRCLVQGCCHGSPAPAAIGIRYLHPRSRVCRLTQWAGIPLHPTPLYSILWNAVVGLLLVRLWTLHAAIALIIGLYFILNGIGRFAEEAWRGEPQTRIVAGLRLYQWAAIASVLLGIAFSMIADPSPAPTPAFHWSAVFAAILFGLFVTFAMGVDFPESDRRFSRLT